MEVYKSILVSNMLDPLTKTNEDLQKMYQTLSNENRYNAIETRLIEDNETRDIFNELVKKNSWNTTFWITGEMSRANLNLSSLNETLRQESVQKAKELLGLANKHNGHNIGIASGVIEDTSRMDEHFESLVRSIVELDKFLIDTKSNYKLLIEPLDSFAHKNNVIGNTEITLKLFTELQKRDVNTISMCWDSAHFALNEDDFTESIKKLSPFITRVHFADAVTDKKHPEYGDNHRQYDDLGVMNTNLAKSILEDVNQYVENDLFIACEVRIKAEEDVWANEEKYYNFLKDVIE